MVMSPSSLKEKAVRDERSTVHVLLLCSRPRLPLGKIQVNEGSLRWWAAPLVPVSPEPPQAETDIA